MASRPLRHILCVLAVLPALLASPPAQAAGPGLPVDITSVELSTDALGGNLVLPDGSSRISTYLRYVYCGGPNGRCGDRPTLQEVTIGRVQSICGGGGSCRGWWVPGTNPRTYQVDFRDALWAEGPTLASLGLANLPPDSWIGVSVRMRNTAGWSQPYDASVQVAGALDPADTLPTNITPPELGSYGDRLSRDLAIGSWISAWDVGKWAPGAVTKPQAVRIQAARCPNAACQVTPAQYEAAGITLICRFPRNDLATQDLNCRPDPWTTITDAPADACWRLRSQALNRKGWSAWAESSKKCLPSANAAAGNGAVNNGVNLDLDLGAIAPLRPGVVNLAQPAPTRLPTLNADQNPASPIPARGSLTTGTSYGAVGTGWNLPNGWQIANLLASTTFTLLGCTGKEPATCTPAGAWPATSLVGQNPALASTGAIGLASPYARIAQSTTMRNATGAQVTRIALSDWVSVVAAPQQPANPPPADAGGDSGQGDAAAGGAEVADGGSGSDAPVAVDIPSALIAAGVDGRVTPLVGTDGEGTYQGLTLKVQIPTVQVRGTKIKAIATVTPGTRGKVWFTYTRTGPTGKVTVSRTRKVTVRRTKAKASWTIDQAKPTGTHLLIVRFVPSKRGTMGALVTKAIVVK